MLHRLLAVALEPEPASVVRTEEVNRETLGEHDWRDERGFAVNCEAVGTPVWG